MAYTEDAFVKEQKKLAKLFTNARKNDHLSHAFLLFGEPSAPLLDSALYLAKSLFCTESVLACGKCAACRRFDEGNAPDFLLIDGGQGRIKKQDIQDLEDFTSMSSVEKGHISCYVINHVENISVEGINALLKTIEEPSGNTIAFLTTSNVEAVLPTIVSRCERVKIETPDLVARTENYTGKHEKAAYYFASNQVYDEQAKEELMDSPEFQTAYDLTLQFCKDMESFGPDAACFELIQATSKNLKGNACYNNLYRFLSILFRSAYLGEGREILKELLPGLNQYRDRLPKAILLLDEAKSKLNANMNGALMLARLSCLLEEQ